MKLICLNISLINLKNNLNIHTKLSIRYEKQVRRRIQMCSLIVTPLGPGQSGSVGKRHCKHAYLLWERPFGTSWFCHCSHNVTVGVVTLGVNICTQLWITLIRLIYSRYNCYDIWYHHFFQHSRARLWSMKSFFRDPFVKELWAPSQEKLLPRRYPVSYAVDRLSLGVCA